MKLDKIIYNVFFISAVFVIELAERNFCFRTLSLRFAGVLFWLIDLFLPALLGKKKSHHLDMMDALTLCTLAFYRVGCALTLFYRKVFGDC